LSHLVNVQSYLWHLGSYLLLFFACLNLFITTSSLAMLQSVSIEAYYRRYRNIFFATSADIGTLSSSYQYLWPSRAGAST